MKMKSQLTARLGRPVVAARRTTTPAAAYALRRARTDVASTGRVLPSATPAAGTAAIVAADRAIRAMLSLKPRGD